MKKALLLLILAAYVTPLVGCKEKGPMEKAGEKVDETAKDAKRTVDDAKD